MEQADHRTASGVSADHDLADLKAINGVFDNRGYAANSISISRNHVADIAGDKNLAWSRLRDQLGVDSGVGAGDEQGVGPLPFAPHLLVPGPLVREDFVLKLLNSRKQSPPRLFYSI
jgi:hypothetical protein